MKKLSLIATAILGLTSATAMAQSSVTLYGIVDAAFVNTSNQAISATATGNVTGIDAGQLATSRWGMRGSEDLGGGLKANFTLESTIANDTGAFGSTFGALPAATPPVAATTSLFDRAAIVGLSGGFGAITLGRQNMLGVDAVASVDPIGFSQPGINPNVAFSSLNNAAAFGGGVYGTNTSGTALRQNNSIRYALPAFSGFSGAAMYGFGERAISRSASSYVGLVGAFNAGPLTASLGYNVLKNAANTDELTLVGGGVKYAISNAFAVKATYTESEVDSTSRKIAVAGVGVDFLVIPALTLTGAYYNTKLTDVVSGKADQFVLKANYALSKRTSIYTLLTHAKADSTAAADRALIPVMTPGAGENSSNRIAIGVFHSF